MYPWIYPWMVLSILPPFIHGYILVKYNDLTVLPNPGIMVLDIGNHPQMAAKFRLVKYYNLPRIMDSDRISFLTGQMNHGS